MYFPTQQDIALLSYPHKSINVKIELLNYQFQTIDMIDGTLIADSYSIDSTTDIRRTISLTMHIDNTSMTLGIDKKIWYDKYIKISVGYLNTRTHEWIYYPAGIFLFSDVGYSYDVDNNELSLNCVDMMSKFTGDRNGYLSGQATTVAVGASIRQVLIDTVTQLGHIAKYRIEDLDETVDIPNDMEWKTGATIYEVLAEIRDLYAGYEMFFDEDTFVFRSIPNCTADPIVLDASIISPLVISEQTNYTLSEMKNVTEVWGRSLDSDYFADSLTVSGRNLTARIRSMTGLPMYTRIGFTMPDNAGGVNAAPILTINGGPNNNMQVSYPIVDDNGNALKSGVLEAGHSYVVRFRNDMFYYLGEYQIVGICKILSREPTQERIDSDLATEVTTNISYMVCPENPFGIDIEGNEEVRQVLSGGEYDNIYSEKLAIDRARYETYIATNLTDTITLTMMEVPWLDVNQKIEYTSYVTGETNQYLVVSKAGSYAEGTMNLTIKRFYDDFDWRTS